MTDTHATTTNPAQPAGTLYPLRARFTATLIDEIGPTPG
jgi:hypothetical protein